MKYLISHHGEDEYVVIDGDTLHRFIEAARAYQTADVEARVKGEPYDVDAAVEVAAVSGYVAGRLADLIHYDELAAGDV